jgi:Sec-independent protein translocase protein TatA
MFGSLGKGIAEFKRATNELQSSLEQEIHLEEQCIARDEAKNSATALPAHDDAARVTKAS